MRPRRFVVGLTGGIGSGKSSALAEFERCGAATLDLDGIAREQARPGREGYRAIVRAFGPGVVGRGGRIDRRALGALAFGDASARRRLERAAHPPILREMDRLIRRLKGLVVVDVPLLFEKRLQGRFDATVLLACPASEQVRRIVRRDGLKAAEARRRLKAQWPTPRKRALADFIIDNDGSRADLRAEVRAICAALPLPHGGTPNGNAD